MSFVGKPSLLNVRPMRATIQCNPRASRRTENRVKENAPDGWVWVEKVSNTIDIDMLSGRWCVLVSAGEAGTGRGWFGWLPLDELILKINGKIWNPVT